MLMPVSSFRIAILEEKVVIVRRDENKAIDSRFFGTQE